MHIAVKYKKNIFWENYRGKPWEDQMDSSNSQTEYIIKYIIGWKPNSKFRQHEDAWREKWWLRETRCDAIFAAWLKLQTLFKSARAEGNHIRKAFLRYSFLINNNNYKCRSLRNIS